jgi:hypothetical protein
MNINFPSFNLIRYFVRPIYTQFSLTTVSNISMGWTIGALGFYSRRGLGIFLFTTEFRPALGSTQPPLKWVPGALSLAVKRPGSGSDHSPPSRAEVKNAGSYTSTPPYVFVTWCLVKQRDNFAFFIFYIHQLETKSSIHSIQL